MTAAGGLADGSRASYDAAMPLAVDLGMFEAAVDDQRKADERREALTIALRKAAVEAWPEPGPQDISWDLAAMIEEFDIRSGRRRRLSRRSQARLAIRRCRNA